MKKQNGEKKLKVFNLTSNKKSKYEKNNNMSRKQSSFDDQEKIVH